MQEVTKVPERTKNMEQMSNYQRFEQTWQGLYSDRLLYRNIFSKKTCETYRCK